MFSVLAYLRRVISEYMDEKELIYNTTECQQRHKVFVGVAEGSALDPDLWSKRR